MKKEDQFLFFSRNQYPITFNSEHVLFDEQKEGEKFDKLRDIYFLT